MTTNNEKRKFKRSSQKLVLRVAFDEGKQPHQWTIVATQNFSAGGVLFTYDKTISDGSSLLFKIHFPDRAFFCHGKVIRATPGFQKPLVNVAASIEGLTEEEMNFIQSYGH